MFRVSRNVFVTHVPPSLGLEVDYLLLPFVGSAPGFCQFLTCRVFFLMVQTCVGNVLSIQRTSNVFHIIELSYFKASAKVCHLF